MLQFLNSIRRRIGSALTLERQDLQVLALPTDNNDDILTIVVSVRGRRCTDIIQVKGFFTYEMLVSEHVQEYIDEFIEKAQETVEKKVMAAQQLSQIVCDDCAIVPGVHEPGFSIQAG